MSTSATAGGMVHRVPRPAVPTALLDGALELLDVEAVLERAKALIAGYDEELAGELPAHAEIFDAHVHLGHDIDGMAGVYEELEAIHERYGISRSFMFCMDEPDRHPAFRAPNDRTLAQARRSGERLIPFVRLDLGEDPIEEATRSPDLGARGIKLHRGPSASCSTTSGSRRSSRSPPTGGCRS